MRMDKDWDRISKALFGAVPQSPSPGFAARVMANLEPRRVPWSWLAPAFAAAMAALLVLAEPPTPEEFLVEDEPAAVVEAQ